MQSLIRYLPGSAPLVLDSPHSGVDYPEDFRPACALPLLRQARALQPGLLVIASPWSPPAWMKTGGSMLGASGGVLRDDCYDVYARYFAQFLKEYEKEGVPVSAVTPQNEPASGPPRPLGRRLLE